jgi:hypothetical protein
VYIRIREFGLLSSGTKKVKKAKEKNRAFFLTSIKHVREREGNLLEEKRYIPSATVGAARYEKLTEVRRSSTKVERSQAERILRELPPEKAFYFYTDIGHPTGVSARSLNEFASALSNVSESSIEFHVLRGDFEKWLIMLGDQNLAHQFGRLRDLRLKGNSLRSRAIELINTRAKTLGKSLGGDR